MTSNPPATTLRCKNRTGIYLKTSSQFKETTFFLGRKLLNNNNKQNKDSIKARSENRRPKNSVLHNTWKLESYHNSLSSTQGASITFTQWVLSLLSSTQIQSQARLQRQAWVNGTHQNASRGLATINTCSFTQWAFLNLLIFTVIF